MPDENDRKTTLGRFLYIFNKTTTTTNSKKFYCK